MDDTSVINNSYDSLCFEKINTGSNNCHYCKNFENITMSSAHYSELINVDQLKLIRENLDIQEIFMKYILGYKDNNLCDLYNIVLNLPKKTKEDRINIIDNINNNNLFIKNCFFQKKIAGLRPKVEKWNPPKEPEFKLSINSIQFALGDSKPGETLYIPGILWEMSNSAYDIFFNDNTEMINYKKNSIKLVIPENISMRFLKMGETDEDTLQDQYALPNMPSQHFQLLNWIGSVSTASGGSFMDKGKEYFKSVVLDKYSIACRQCKTNIENSDKDSYQYLCLHNQGVKNKNFTCYIYKLKKSNPPNADDLKYCQFENLDENKSYIFIYFGMWGRKIITNEQIIKKSIKHNIYKFIEKYVLNYINENIGLDIDIAKKEINGYSDLFKFFLKSQTNAIFTRAFDTYRVVVSHAYPSFIKYGNHRQNIMTTGFKNIASIYDEQKYTYNKLLRFYEKSENGDTLFDIILNTLKYDNIWKEKMLMLPIDNEYNPIEFDKLTVEEKVIIFCYFLKESSELALMYISSEAITWITNQFKTIASILGLGLIINTFESGAGAIVSTIGSMAVLYLQFKLLFMIKNYIISKILNRGGNIIKSISILMLYTYKNKEHNPQLEMIYELSKTKQEQTNLYYLVGVIGRDNRLSDVLGADSNKLQYYNIHSLLELYKKTNIQIKENIGHYLISKDDEEIKKEYLLIQENKKLEIDNSEADKIDDYKFYVKPN
jgi:hypothetical protein